MAYEPTEWKTGDIVTSAKLNKLEQGVAGAGGGVMSIHVNDGGVMDKTWAEINEAYQNGLYCSVISPVTGSAVQGCNQLVILSVVHGEPGYIVYVVMRSYDSVDSNTVYFITDSENGYPVYNQDQGGGGQPNV